MKDDAYISRKQQQAVPVRRSLHACNHNRNTGNRSAPRTRNTVDYSRTENVQFEDDEYYYYVKAIPKMSVEAPDVNVTRMGYRDEPEDDLQYFE